MDVVYNPGAKRSLAVVIPHLGRNRADKLALFRDTSKICQESTDAGLFFLSFQEDTPVQNGLTSCFQTINRAIVRRSRIDSTRTSTLFGEFLLQHLHQLTKYEYFIWLDPDTVPVRDFWLTEVLGTVKRGGPFLVKASPFFGDKDGVLENINIIQKREGDRNPKPLTYQTLRMSGTALYGSWNLPFLRLVYDVISSISGKIVQPEQDTFENILTWFWFNDACTFKTLSPYLVFDFFLLNSPRLFHLNDAPPETILVNRPFKCNKDSRPVALEMLFEREWFTCLDSVDKETFEFLSERNFRTSGLTLALRQSCLSTITNRQQAAYYALEDRLGVPCSTFPPIGPKKRGEPKLLVAIIFSAKQFDKLLYALSRIRNPNYWPCNRIGNNFGLLFIQSDPVGQSLEKKLFSLLRHFAGPLKCFSEINFQFVDIPEGDDGYKYGPPEMFKEMILGVFSDGYDYALQIEPDVFPIRKNWLDRTMESALEDDFWVKGSAGLYPDQNDFEQGCLQTIALKNGNNIAVGPFGPRMLHINGNALYSLGHDFRSVVREFFSQASIAPYGLCPRNDRMKCSLHMCSGSFDTSLAEFLFLNAQHGAGRLTKYRYTSFFVNDIDPFIPFTRLMNATTFMHKPWKGLKEIQNAAYQDADIKLLVTELESCAADGCRGFSMEQRTFFSNEQLQ